MEIPKRAFRFSKKLQRISKKLNRYQAIGDTRDLYLKYKRRLLKVANSMIGPKGCIKLIASERDPDIITSGDMYVSKIIGYPFKSKEDEEEFLANRLKLLKLLDEFRTRKGITIKQDLHASN